MAYLKGWRYSALIGGLFGLLGLTLYPIAVSPMLDPTEYRMLDSQPEILIPSLLKAGIEGGKLVPLYSAALHPSEKKISFYYTINRENIQKETRKNIRQEDIQPGNMKVWSDPFGRKKPDSQD